MQFSAFFPITAKNSTPCQDDHNKFKALLPSLSSWWSMREGTRFPRLQCPFVRAACFTPSLPSFLVPSGILISSVHLVRKMGDSGRILGPEATRFHMIMTRRRQILLKRELQELRLISQLNLHAQSGFFFSVKIFEYSFASRVARKGKRRGVALNKYNLLWGSFYEKKLK